MENKNNQVNYNKKGTSEEVSEQLRDYKKQRERILLAEKKTAFHCDHKDRNGRANLSSVGDGVLRCNRCGTEIYTATQTLAEVQRKIDEILNIIELVKLLAEPEYVPGLAKIEEGVDSLSKVYDNIVLKGKKKKGNKHNNNNGNVRRASYNQSKL